MALNREEIIKRRRTITKGVRLVCDAGGAVTVVRSARSPRSACAWSERPRWPKTSLRTSGKRRLS